MANYLTFSSPSSFTLTTNNSTKNWDGMLEYSTDKSTWIIWGGTTALSASGGKLYLRGTGNTKITGGLSNKRWVLTGSNITCEGNIENLLDYTTVANGGHPTMSNYCYCHMFNGCTSLISAPTLPATALATKCYGDMFYNCTSLTSAPELPATKLADYCYADMFMGCTSLMSAPALPATNAPTYCYYNMFYGCTSLTSTPELPATTIATYCYSGMFSGCTSLTSAPELPATKLADYCYYNMFYNCTSLTSTPELPATALASYCYSDMFRGCTSLTSVPELPATTLPQHCYSNMFSYCTNIKMSATQTAEYKTAYRIPSVGNGTAQSYSLSAMFYPTGGSFSGTPVINTIYYISNGETAIPTVITYNGNEIAILEEGQSAIFPEGKKATGDVSIVFGSNGSITYKGVTTEVEKGKTAHLLVSGKKFATDVVINTKR